MTDQIRKANANIPEKPNPEYMSIFQRLDGTGKEFLVIIRPVDDDEDYTYFQTFKDAYNYVHEESLHLNPDWHKEYCDHKDCTGKEEEVVEEKQFEMGSG